MLLSICFNLKSYDQNLNNTREMDFDTIKIESHIKGLHVALLHMQPKTITGNIPVLFIHGSSFPSALAFGFRMNGLSWMDYLAENNFESFALDFLGYGNSDRYPEMLTKHLQTGPPGRAKDVYQDIDSAVNYILKKTGNHKINIIAHSWGGTVAALYASKFPEKINKLVLFSPLTPGKSAVVSGPVDYSYESMTPGARVNDMRNLTPQGNISRLEPALSDKWQSQWLKSDPLSEADGKEEVRFPSGPSKDIDDLEHGGTYYDPSRIKAETMIVRGEWDSSPSNEAAGVLFEQLTNAPSKKYVVIEKGTHVMHLEKSRLQLYNETLFFLNNSPMQPNNHSIAVIFEVIPNKGEKQEYLDIAAKLKPELEKIDGFISIERFQSLTHPEKILSLSFWRDEDAIQHWRNLELHRDAQTRGRSYIFNDYHLRIAGVIRDYGMLDRKEAPADSKQYHK